MAWPWARVDGGERGGNEEKELLFLSGKSPWLRPIGWIISAVAWYSVSQECRVCEVCRNKATGHVVSYEYYQDEILELVQLIHAAREDSRPAASRRAYSTSHVFLLKTSGDSWSSPKLCAVSRFSISTPTSPPAENNCCLGCSLAVPYIESQRELTALWW